MAVRVGEVIRLQCLAHGTPPLTYAWSKLEGRLPPRAEVNGGDLQINLATAEDAGSYKCVASNKVGSSQVVAKVTVRCKYGIQCWCLGRLTLEFTQHKIRWEIIFVQFCSKEQSTFHFSSSNSPAPLAVRVSPQVEVKAQGSAVEFTCSAAGGVETKIEWLKEGGALPPNHHVKDGVLRCLRWIFNGRKHYY